MPGERQDGLTKQERVYRAIRERILSGTYGPGYRVVIDTDALAFDYGEITGGEFRRKLRTLAGVWQIWARKPQLFTSSDRMRFHFLPHKFGRVAFPWMVLAGLIAIAFLPAGSTRLVLATLALLVLALALIDPLLPKNFFLRRISSPARSFLIMNLAALLSVSVFFVSPDRLWKPTRVAEADTKALLGEQTQKP